jgi:hypothetical protein
MPTTARGTFDVKINPLTPYNMSEGAMLGRMSIDKHFSGDLEASSQGEMLSAGTAVQGSAAYVAIERVTGTLGGKQGSFVLQHTGLMDRGAPSLVVTIVPDSATGELEGLTGAMTIIVTEEAHMYEMVYEAGEKPAT